MYHRPPGRLSFLTVTPLSRISMSVLAALVLFIVVGRADAASDPLPTITKTLGLATPVTCVNTEVAWTRHQAPDAGGFYLPRAQGGPRIYLGPGACADLREFTKKRCDRWLAMRGVQLLAHELEHALQDRQGRPFDEAQAERVGWLRAPGMFRKLARAFDNPCR